MSRGDVAREAAELILAGNSDPDQLPVNDINSCLLPAQMRAKLAAKLVSMAMDAEDPEVAAKVSRVLLDFEKVNLQVMALKQQKQITDDPDRYGGKVIVISGELKGKLSGALHKLRQEDGSGRP